MALDAAINSYITVDNACVYLGDRLHCSAWSNASPADQKKAFAQAYRILDKHYFWEGRMSQSPENVEFSSEG